VLVIVELIELDALDEMELVNDDDGVEVGGTVVAEVVNVEDAVV
jgi:hypothetical protein